MTTIRRKKHWNSHGEAQFNSSSLQGIERRGKKSTWIRFRDIGPCISKILQQDNLENMKIEKKLAIHTICTGHLNSCVEQERNIVRQSPFFI